MRCKNLACGRFKKLDTVLVENDFICMFSKVLKLLMRGLNTLKAGQASVPLRSSSRCLMSFSDKDSLGSACTKGQVKAGSQIMLMVSLSYSASLLGLTWPQLTSLGLT